MSGNVSANVSVWEGPMDDERAVDEDGEEALFEYLFGYEAAVQSEREETPGPLLPP
jgi:hypothetical protein